jgi:epoxide hydrolase
LLTGIAVAGSVAAMLPKAASAKSGPFKLSASDITPFKINLPSAALDDLKQRLGAIRWPEKETVADWSQGVPLAKMQALASYWRSGYELRACFGKLR